MVIIIWVWAHSPFCTLTTPPMDMWICNLCYVLYIWRTLSHLCIFFRLFSYLLKKSQFWLVILFIKAYEILVISFPIGLFKKLIILSVVDTRYYISFRCTTWWFNLSVCYVMLTPSVAIICHHPVLLQYHWLYSLCCAFYSNDLFIP